MFSILSVLGYLRICSGLEKPMRGYGGTSSTVAMSASSQKGFCPREAGQKLRAHGERLQAAQKAGADHSITVVLSQKLGTDPSNPQQTARCKSRTFGSCGWGSHVWSRCGMQTPRDNHPWVRLGWGRTQGHYMSSPLNTTSALSTTTLEEHLPLLVLLAACFRKCWGLKLSSPLVCY